MTNTVLVSQFFIGVWLRVLITYNTQLNIYKKYNRIQPEKVYALTHTPCLSPVKHPTIQLCMLLYDTKEN